MQGHLAAFGTPVDQKKLADFFVRLKTLGLKLLVTEHDVDDSGGPSDVALRDRAVADASRRFLDVVLDACPLAVLTWGLSDRFLDVPGVRAELAGYRPRMLPLDRDFRKKPMWQAIADAFTTA
jgi:endo-1,4-beta-xylanase